MTGSGDRAPLRTVRLTEKDQSRLLAQLERAGSGFDDHADRRRIRVPFSGTVIVLLDNPSGGCMKYAVVPRNISSEGLAFIHGQFIYANRTCRVIVPTLQGQWVAVKASVLHTRHIEGLIHQVAVRFGETIDLAQFVDLTPEQTERHRRERARSGLPPEGSGDAALGATRLQGHVLLMDPLEVDRRLFALWLGGQGLSIAEAAGPEKALEEFARVPPKIVMVDVDAKVGGGLEMIKDLRGKGFSGPIAAVSANDADATQAAAMAAGCNAFLAKPCDRAAFVQMIEQLLSFDPALQGGGSGDPIVSALAGDTQMGAMVEKFVDSLGPGVEKLAAAVRTGDLQTLRTICQQMKGSGGAYGLAPLTQMARLALGQIEAPKPDLKAVGLAIDDLIGIARRVRAK